MLTLLLISMMLFGLNGTVAQAATTTVTCSMSGTFTITDNVVSGNDDCTGIATVPAEVTSIGVGAFQEDNPYYGSALTAVTFAAGSQLTSIGEAAFRNAIALTEITIPAGVTSIGTYAFFYANALTAITIPVSVTSIGVNAFTHTASLTAITVASANTAYASVAGVLYNKALTQLEAYPAKKIGTTYTIPAGVTHYPGGGHIHWC